MKIAHLILFLLFFTMIGFSAEEADTLVVSFSNPSRPGTIKSEIMMGSIKVRTHARNDVLVISKASGNVANLVMPDVDIDMDFDSNVFVVPGNKRDDTPDPDKIKGLQKIQSSQFGINVEESENIIEIKMPPMAFVGGANTALTLVVPRRTSLQLKSMGGTIEVENVNGEIEVEGMGGALTLNDVGGTIVAHTMGDIKATIREVSPDKPMSFSTFGGDIDVTLPPTIKATFKLKSHGDIYTDFDTSRRKLTKNVSESRKDDRYEGKIESVTEIPVNGGGQDIEFTNFSGTIYIRKSK